MSDPYNSYVDHVPAVRPVAAPATARAAAKPMDPIARLDVSDAWKRKFRLIEKAGGPTLPNFRELPFGERYALGLNFLAFLFGPFYYLAKGLWRQAVLYFILAFALVVVLELVGLGKISRGIGYGFAAVYGLRANTSYYRRVVLGEAPWV